MRITALESRVNDMEQYCKKDNIIVSGLGVHTGASLSYSGSVKATKDVVDDEVVLRAFPSVARQMKEDFIKAVEQKLDVSLHPSDIVAIRELPQNRQGEKPIIVRFANSEVKRSVMSCRKKLKNTKIFFNDQLTKTNAAIFKRTRDLRASSQLHATWTMNGRIFVKNTENSKPYEIKTINQVQGSN